MQRTRGYSVLNAGNRSLWLVNQLRSLAGPHFPTYLCGNYALRVLEFTSSDCSKGLYLFQARTLQGTQPVETGLESSDTLAAAALCSGGSASMSLGSASGW